MTSILFVIKEFQRNHFKCNYLWHKKLFLDFLLHFGNLHQALNILKKKTTLTAYVFPKLQTVKGLVRPMSKKPRLRTSFDSQHVNGSQTTVKSAWMYFYQFFFITLMKTDVENVSLSDMWSLLAFCQNIDCRWQIYFLQKWEFTATNFNVII